LVYTEKRGGIKDQVCKERGWGQGKKKGGRKVRGGLIFRLFLTDKKSSRGREAEKRSYNGNVSKGKGTRAKAGRGERFSMKMGNENSERRTKMGVVGFGGEKEEKRREAKKILGYREKEQCLTPEKHKLRT